MLNSLKKAGYVLLPLLVYYVAHDVSRLIFMFILQALANVSGGVRNLYITYDTLFGALISIADMAVGALAVIFLMKKDSEELALGDYVNLNGISFYREDRIHPVQVSWILIGIQGISAALGLNMLFTMTGLSSAAYSRVSSSQYSVPVWVGIILYGIVSPTVEELLFRVVIFGRMKRRFPYIISVIVTSCFFGLYHRNLVQGIYGTLMGILMCLSIEYLHTVTASVMFHSLANLSVYLLGTINVFGTEKNPLWCTIFMGIALVTLILEFVFTYRSRRKYGIEYGIAYVGCFFVDETLYDEE